MATTPNQSRVAPNAEFEKSPSRHEAAAFLMGKNILTKSVSPDALTHGPQQLALVIEGTTLESNLEAMRVNYLFLPVNEKDLRLELDHAYACETQTRTLFNNWGLDSPVGPMPFRFWVVPAGNFDELEIAIALLDRTLHSSCPIFTAAFNKQEISRVAAQLVGKLAGFGEHVRMLREPIFNALHNTGV